MLRVGALCIASPPSLSPSRPPFLSVPACLPASSLSFPPSLSASSLSSTSRPSLPRSLPPKALHLQSSCLQLRHQCALSASPSGRLPRPATRRQGAMPPGLWLDCRVCCCCSSRPVGCGLDATCWSSLPCTTSLPLSRSISLRSSLSRSLPACLVASFPPLLSASSLSSTSRPSLPQFVPLPAQPCTCN